MLKMIVCCCVLIPFMAQAQTPDSTLALPPLPSLQVLVDAALAYHPDVAFYQAEEDQKNAEVSLAKRQWTNKVFTDVGYGYTNNFAANTLIADGQQTDAVNFKSGDVYRAGITFRLSLFDLVGRPKTIDRAQADLKKSQIKQQQAAIHIKSEVIRLYQLLLAARQNVGISAESVAALQMHQQMAEQQFAAGELPIAELARVTELYNRARANFANATNQEHTARLQLQNYTGYQLL